MRDLPLRLNVDNNNRVIWLIDSLHAVHDDCQSHTGSVLTLGKGSISSKSMKQKLNTKSSTESELVVVDDMMGDVLWTNYFLKSQGYNISKTIIEQDNQSAILLERNSKASSTK